MSEKGGDDSNQPKRRRRGGWDAPGTTPLLPPLLGIQALTQKSALGMLPQVQNIGLHSAAISPLVQSPGGNILAQQLALQQTQQLLAQQALQNSLSNLTSVVASVPVKTIDCRIYVGSLHYDIGTADISALFSCFGTISKVDMSFDTSTQRSKGYCFVEFADPACAAAAIAMDGFELAGRKIKVGRPAGAGGSSFAPPPSPTPAQQAAMLALSNSFGAGSSPGVGSASLGANPMDSIMQAISTQQQAQMLLSQALGGGVASLKAGTAPIPAPPIAIPRTSNSSSDTITIVPTDTVKISNIHVDVTEEMLRGIFSPFGEVKLFVFEDVAKAGTEAEATLQGGTGTAPTRVAKVTFGSVANAEEATRGMDKVALAGLELKLEQLSAQVTEAGRATPTLTSVLLEDMVTAAEAREADFRDEVEEEAGNYGQLQRVDVVVGAPPEEAVKVTLVYKNAAEAAKAFRAMNGRYFGGKPIRASLLPDP